MTYSTISTGAEREALTLSLLESVTPFLRQYARSSGLDYEELYQDASIKIMQILDRYLDQITHLQAYVMVSVKRLVLRQMAYQRKRRAVSLDGPLMDDVSLSFADLLPSPYSVEPVVVLLAQERLEELETRVSSPSLRWNTRRMLRELRDTAVAGVSVGDHARIAH